MLLDPISDLVTRTPLKVIEREALNEAIEDASAGVQELEADIDELRAAAHMLHEQAHGSIPWTTCASEPCAHLWSERDHGPAAWSLAAGVA